MLMIYYNFHISYIIVTFALQTIRSMSTFITDLGYEVTETLGGLEVNDDGKYACTLDGKTLEDYTYDDVIDSEELDNDIMEMVETEDFINYQKEYC